MAVELVLDAMAKNATEEQQAVQRGFAKETGKGMHKDVWAEVQAVWAEYKRVEAQLP